MSVITVSRQLGSLGTTLGRQVAARLGYRMVQRELINRAVVLRQMPPNAMTARTKIAVK